MQGRITDYGLYGEGLCYATHRTWHLYHYIADDNRLLGGANIATCMYYFYYLCSHISRCIITNTLFTSQCFIGYWLFVIYYFYLLFGVFIVSFAPHLCMFAIIRL